MREESEREKVLLVQPTAGLRTLNLKAYEKQEAKKMNVKALRKIPCRK